LRRHRRHTLSSAMSTALAYTPHSHVRHQSMEDVLAAFDCAFKVREVGEYGAQELVALSRAGETNGVMAVLQQGCVDPNAMAKIEGCNHPVTALCAAASCGHAETVDMLLRAGACPNFSCGNGYTPIYLAAQGGHDACVAQLLAAHADIERPTADGATSLLVACHQGHASIVHRLLAYGANMTTLADGQVLSAAEVAAAAGQAECIALIRACEEHRGLRVMPPM